ncbi:hypothetical protein N9Y89_01550 [bacterium]|nr:hypothetical protein [bacterium]
MQITPSSMLHVKLEGGKEIIESIERIVLIFLRFYTRHEEDFLPLLGTGLVEVDLLYAALHKRIPSIIDA